MAEMLKPCPFCGGEADVHYFAHDDSECTVMCSNPNCRASVSARSCGSMTTAYNRARKLWNRRVERMCRVGCYPPGHEDNLHYEVCSECGTILTASRPGDGHAARASYCPSCGARVVSER